MQYRRFHLALLAGALSMAIPACGSASSTKSTTSTTAVTTTTAAPTTTVPAPTTTVPTRIEYPGGSTFVSGHIDDFSADDGTVTTDADGSQHTRNGTISDQMVSDDPRVSGKVTGTWNSDRWGTLYNGAMVQWGTATLTNDGGSWTADYSGVFTSFTGDVITRWWVGSGGYAGLTFYMWIDHSKPGVADFQWKGLIFRGAPPTTTSK